MVIEQIPEEGTPLGRIPDDPHQPVDEDPELVQSILDELHGGTTGAPLETPMVAAPSLPLPPVSYAEEDDVSDSDDEDELPAAVPARPPVPAKHAPWKDALRTAGVVALAAALLFSPPVRTLLAAALSRIPLPAKDLWIPAIGLLVPSLLLGAISVAAVMFL